jgi:hypothetical protein
MNLLARTLHIHPNKDDPFKFDQKTVDLTTVYGPDGELIPPPRPRLPPSQQPALHVSTSRLANPTPK